MQKKRKGKCKWFDAVKGFGFITPDGGQNDIFVHYSNIVGSGDADYRSLDAGEPVEYNEETSERAGGKMQAINVVPIER